jgi:glycosyltransferase involved in cell wall biosynthesis
LKRGGETGTGGGRWHVVTCEYPPRTGGVSDYTRVVAEGLAAAGEEVCVWCPPASEAPGGGARGGGAGGAAGAGGGRLAVREECGEFKPADLRRVGRLLDAEPGPRRLLVQYVPHGYGRRAVNVGFCFWLWRRARLKGDRVEVMVHEPFIEFGHSPLRWAAAAAQRVMAALLVNAAERVWTSTPEWERLWRPYALGRRVEFGWLPVPNVVPVVADAELTARARARYAAPGGVLVGHFGTHPRPVAEQMAAVLAALLARRPEASALLVGRGGEALRDRLRREHPSLGARVQATGVLAAAEVSAHLAACDLLAQPFPDGVTGRRTSVMAGLAHGLPVVTTAGRLTEPLWAAGGAVRLVAAGGAGGMVEAIESLLADAGERRRLGEAGRAFYREHFDAPRVVAALRRGGAAGEAVPGAVPAGARY